jgi:hypothetical protein
MICSCCYTDKPESDYPKTPSGTRSYCKTCYSYIRWWNRQKPESKAVHNAASRRWVSNNREGRQAVQAKRKEIDKELVRNWKANNRGKVNAYSAHRRASKKKATPLWADLNEIVHIYEVAKERGLVVDHIVPLTHPLVCGLHTPDNLRCISVELNSFKGNRYFPDSLPVLSK